MIFYGVSTAESQSIKKNAGIEGELEFGQKNISTLKRNLLNADEILRIPYNELLVNIRGNKPLMLNKMIYTEHKLAKQLKDVPVNSYKPNWNTEKVQEIKQKIEKDTIENKEESEEVEEITFDNF